MKKYLLITLAILNFTGFAQQQKNKQQLMLSSIILPFGEALPEKLVFENKGSLQSTFVTGSQLDSSYSWRWDSLSASYLVNSKILYTNDANGNPLTLIYQNRIGNNWVNSFKNSNIYDTNNNLIDQVISVPNGTIWKDTLRNIYAYDIQFNDTMFIRQEWNGTSWENKYQLIYAYNSSNNLTYRASKDWDGTTWINYWQAITTYTGNNMITDLQQFWVSGNWDNDMKIDYVYDVNNDMVMLTSFLWNSTTWDALVQIIYTYDSNHNAITRQSATWLQNVWQTSYMDSMFYNANNLETKRLSLYWDNNSWVSDYEYLWVYDSSNNCTFSSIQLSDSTGWKDVTKLFYTYNTDNKLASSVFQNTWVNGVFKNFDSTYYYYSNPAVFIKETENELYFKAYPNPFSTSLTVFAEKEYPLTIKLYDLASRKLFEQSFINTIKINTEQFDKGAYILQILDKNGIFKMEKIIKY